MSWRVIDHRPQVQGDAWRAGLGVADGGGQACRQRGRARARAVEKHQRLRHVSAKAAIEAAILRIEGKAKGQPVEEGAKRLVRKLLGDAHVDEGMRLREAMKKVDGDETEGETETTRKKKTKASAARRARASSR